ncbi:MAG: hypothetical protein U1E51_04410, partial [Candidatus Binatia bacterium]|nr:hypothetical protein [Candidatus Binatia bacterium]
MMKDDLAGRKLPSGDFGENAAWWWIMVLSLNLNVIMKSLVLGGAWVGKRMKAIRFGVIHLPGRILSRARGLGGSVGEEVFCLSASDRGTNVDGGTCGRALGVSVAGEQKGETRSSC